MNNEEPKNCVCCGEPNQTGRYDNMAVCFPCYQTGLLREWLDALEDGFRAEARRLVNLGLTQDSNDHRIAGLVVDAIGKAFGDALGISIGHIDKARAEIRGGLEAGV